MLTVTKKAVALLRAAKAAEGASPEAGIRIRSGTTNEDSGRPALTVGFAICDEPYPDDEQIEESGLRIFVEETLIEPLDGRTLDVREAEDGPELVFR